jgi:cardiolipin synthase
VEAIAGTPLRTRCAVKPLIDGGAAYSAMLDLLEAAETQVLFENFIFRDDAVGAPFADELKARAGDGVDVRVLHDPFGSLMSRRSPIGLRFRRSPADVRAYNPPRPTGAFLRAGRDHRKLVVQDRRRAVVGGLCLADAWLGNCIERCTWRDSAVLVEGVAAGDAARAFDDAWRRGVSFVLGRRRAGEAAPADVGGGRETADPGTVPVRVVADGFGRRAVEQILLQVTAAARREVLITNPYFLPTPGLTRALERAARRGVIVEVIVPLNNNHRVVALASEHAWGPLLRAGVRIWRWTGPMIHAKTVVVDRAWTLVGSSNLDTLSLGRNAELNVEIHGSAMGRAMAAVFTRDRTLSRAMSLDEWNRRTQTRRIVTRLAASLRRWL